MTKLTGRKAPTRWRYEYKQNGDLHVWHPATWGLRESDIAAAKAAGIRKRVSDVRRLSGRQGSTKPSDWVASPVRGLTGLAPGHEAWVYVVVREHGALEVHPGPMWKHDCDSCTFLGRMRGAGFTLPPVDLYAHVYEDSVSVIARHSSDGPDYSSTDIRWIEDDHHNLHLFEAKLRYQEINK